MAIDSLINTSSGLLNSISVLFSSLTYVFFVTFCIFITVLGCCAITCVVLSIKTSLQSWQELRKDDFSRNNSTYMRAQSVDCVKGKTDVTIV